MCKYYISIKNQKSNKRRAATWHTMGALPLTDFTEGSVGFWYGLKVLSALEIFHLSSARTHGIALSLVRCERANHTVLLVQSAYTWLRWQVLHPFQCRNLKDNPVDPAAVCLPDSVGHFGATGMESCPRTTASKGDLQGPWTETF